MSYSSASKPRSVRTDRAARKAACLIPPPQKHEIIDEPKTAREKCALARGRPSSTPRIIAAHKSIDHQTPHDRLHGSPRTEVFGRQKSDQSNH